MAKSELLEVALKEVYNKGVIDGRKTTLEVLVDMKSEGWDLNEIVPIILRDLPKDKV